MSKQYTPLQYDIRYRLGTRTFIHKLLQYGFWFLLIGISLVYVSWSIYFGVLRPATDTFLAEHYTQWYINTGMLSYWIFLTGISFLLVGTLRGWVMYRQHTFLVDRHAFHLRRGLFRTRETRIPYSQISNIEIERPYHYRILGLAQLDVTISSGDRDTGRSMDTRAFLIPIIDSHLAHSLSHHIIRHGSHRDDVDTEYEDSEEEYDDIDSNDTDSEATNSIDGTDELTPQEIAEAARYKIVRRE